MGCGEADDGLLVYPGKPSLDTTKHIYNQIDRIDFVLHLGDISYAKGYASMVCVLVFELIV